MQEIQSELSLILVVLYSLLEIFFKTPIIFVYCSHF